jgi:hypothetical protein
VHQEYYIADSDKTTAALSDDLSIGFVPSAKLATQYRSVQAKEGKTGNCA